MSKLYKLIQSRLNWKEKAINYCKSNRYLRKENRRAKKDRDRYKRELRQSNAEIKRLNKHIQKITLPANQGMPLEKEGIVFLTLQLFLEANISFRAVNRVLTIFSMYWRIKVPVTQTIINWVTRLSIARILNPICNYQLNIKHLSNGFIWLLDTTIALGVGRIIAILAVDMKHFAMNQTAPTLKQVHCVAVAVAASWTGDAIAEFLEKTIEAVGRPAAYLKDGGKDLAKATRILDKKSCGSECISDISHFSANLLKNKYQEHPMFDTFSSAVGSVSKKLKQTFLACLAPPKVSTRSRFMNFHRLVNWASQLLNLSPRGRASEGSVLSELRANLDKLPECKNFIKNFQRDANILLDCQKTLKNKGLNLDTYEECKSFLEGIPSNSSIRIGATEWLDDHFIVAKKLGLEDIGMPISSDNIESLFGVSKKHGTPEMKDANRIALRIPSLCGKLTPEDAKRVLSISVKEQQKVEDSLPSLTKQRRMVLPKPENLEKLKSNDNTPFLELIPRPKKRSKNSDSKINSNYCKNDQGPVYMLDPIYGIPPNAQLALQ